MEVIYTDIFRPHRKTKTRTIQYLKSVTNQRLSNVFPGHWNKQSCTSLFKPYGDVANITRGSPSASPADDATCNPRADKLTVRLDIVQNSEVDSNV